EAFHRLHQADVALGNQVQQWQAKIRVVMRDLDHQTQIRPDHQRARFAIALLNFSGQLDLLLRGQKRDLPDLTQVNLNSGIAIFSSHITLFHRSFGGIGSTTSCTFYSAAVYGVDAYEIEIEVNGAGGDPNIVIVGLPDAAVKESRDRVTTAIANSGYYWPRGRTTINLAPADIKKEGPSFDLPIALGM